MLLVGEQQLFSLGLGEQLRPGLDDQRQLVRVEPPAGEDRRPPDELACGRGQLVDARGDHRLDGRRQQAIGRRGPGRRHGSLVSDQHPGDLDDEQRIAAGVDGNTLGVGAIQTARLHRQAQGMLG
jgi:hypothetical protein